MADSLPSILTRSVATLRSRWSVLLVGFLLFASMGFAFRGLAAIRLEQFRQGLMQEESVAADMELLDTLQDEQRSGNTHVESEIRSIRGRLTLQLSMLAGRRSLWVLLQSPYFLIDVGPYLFASVVISLMAVLGTFTLAILSLHVTDSLHDMLRRVLPVLPSMLLMFLANVGLTLLFVPVLYIICERSGIWLPPFLAGSLQVGGIFVSYFVAIMIGPRLAISSVVMTEEQGTVRSALHKSWERTRGQWSPILWNMILVLIGLLLLRTAVLAIMEPIMEPFNILELLIRTFLFHGLVVLFGVFLAQMTIGISAASKESDVTNADTAAA